MLNFIKRIKRKTSFKTENVLWFLYFILFIALISLISGNLMPEEVSTPCEICKEWEMITSVKVEEKLTVLKYRSRRTGLTVVLGSAENPIVSGRFCLATEAFDDDGLPHTLEHLIFLGSEDYPYKDTLDNLAKRQVIILNIIYGFIAPAAMFFDLI